MKASLAELEAVAAVARAGGFRAAARELGASSSALSHAIAALEERLGVRLFNRTTRSVALSEAGEHFVGEIAPALAAIDGALDAVGARSSEPNGVLRLNMTAQTAHLILAPILLAYHRRYPRVGIEITTDNALIDIVAQGYDAGIRPTQAVPPDMIAVPIVPSVRSVVVGAPSYFKAHSKPRTPADLLQHQCIRARLPSGRIWRWDFERAGETVLVDVQGALLLDDGPLMREAALAGAGLAYLSDRMVAADIAAKRLVQVLDAWTPPYDGLSLYFAGRRHVPAKLRALIDLIRAAAPL